MRRKLKLDPRPIRDIRGFRLKLDMNQSEFWKPLGVTQSAGSRYESKKKKRKMPGPLVRLIRILYPKVR